MFVIESKYTQTHKSETDSWLVDVSVTTAALTPNDVIGA